MRYYGRRRPRYAAKETGANWLCFSDLMSAVMLVFVLILFYSVYQYFDMLEIKTTELMRQSGLLDQKETELNTKDAELQSSQQKLTESEQALIQQQAKLLLSEKELEDSQALLTSQKEELEATRALLSGQQAQMDEQQALLSQQESRLSAQQSQMDEQQSLLSSQQTLLLEQQTRLDELVGVRAKIIADLAAKLSAANVKAVVDAKTGSITLDASVLFDFGGSELKDTGMAMLDQFLPIYFSVLMDGENSANISEIIIEGHTDTVGSYMANLELSQKRALAVMQYILSDDYDKISGRMKEKLRQIATANGRSFSNPVYYAGTEEIDMDASRRVEFKFRLQDERMIESMRQILESME